MFSPPGSVVEGRYRGLTEGRLGLCMRMNGEEMRVYDSFEGKLVGLIDSHLIMERAQQRGR